MKNVIKEYIKDFHADIDTMINKIASDSTEMVENIELSNIIEIIDGKSDFAINSNEKFDKTIYFAAILFLIATKYKMFDNLEKDETDLDKLISEIFSEEIAGEIILES